MHSLTLLLTAAAGLFSLGSAGQVNFYWDQNCRDYAGSVNVGSFQITGGPAGSHSAMWISRDQDSCSRTCGPLIICGDSNCNQRRSVPQWPSGNACAGFGSGVWAKNGCGQDMCGNA